MSQSIRVSVKVCAASKPRATKTEGQFVTRQEVVFERGVDKSPIVVERTYFDEKQVLSAGAYTAELVFYPFNTKNAAGYPEQRICVAFSDLQKA